MTDDLREPQWEDCKVCGGDHWTKDHPASGRDLATQGDAPMTDLRAALLRAHTEPAHDPETCTAHCFVVEALSAPTDRATLIAARDYIIDCEDPAADALIDRINRALSQSSETSPDRADPERLHPVAEFIRDVRTAVGTASKTRKDPLRRDPCEYHNHEKYGCPLGLIGDLARETLTRHDELEASGWVMEPIPDEVRAALTPPPAGNATETPDA